MSTSGARFFAQTSVNSQFTQNVRNFDKGDLTNACSTKILKDLVEISQNGPADLRQCTSLTFCSESAHLEQGRVLVVRHSVGRVVASVVARGAGVRGELQHLAPQFKFRAVPISNSVI